MRLLGLAASYRTASLNRRLMGHVASQLAAAGHEVTVPDFRELGIPFYDGDVESAGFPESVTALGAAIREADAVVIATPEYNYSFPGTLKNAIDWVSRLRPVPFRGKPMFLMCATTSVVGGQRCLWALRQPLEALGAHLHPDMFGLAQANVHLAEDGSIRDEALAGRLRQNLEGFTDFAARLTR